MFTVVLMLLCCGKISRAAQPVSDSLRTELQKASNQLYKEGNNEYVVVDAIIDGFIQPGQPYQWGYKDGVLTINKYPLAAGYESKYAIKFKQQLFNTKKPSGWITYTTSEGVKLPEIFDTASFVRKPYKMKPMPDTHPLLAMLTEDGLIDSLNCCIKYNLCGFYVNNKRLDAAQTEKYTAYLLTQGIYVNNGKGGFSVSRGNCKD